MPANIVIRDLVKTYRRGKVKALNGLNAEFVSGKTHGLIGPNGSGKTTLMGCLLGLLHRDAGQIDIAGLIPESIDFKRQLGYVPERLRFDMWMKAWEFMEYHDHLAGLEKASRKERVAQCLTRIGLEEKSWQERLKTFSRGNLQRLGLAQAILNQPQYLFLDEPTSGMDPVGVILFRKVVQEEAQRGCMVLLSSHQLNQVEQLCDEIHFIEKGQIIDQNPGDAHGGENILKVRWMAASKKTAGIKAHKFSSAVRLLHFSDLGAEFKVKGEEGSREVIETLVKKGVPVIEAVPETSRLERFFLEEEGKTHD